MFKKILLPLIVLFAFSACNSTKTTDGAYDPYKDKVINKGQQGNSNSGNNVDNSDSGEFGVDSGDLQTFKLIPGDNNGARTDDRVFFGYDSSTLSYEAQSVLDNQAAWLNANPSQNVIVEGHTDERGTREYNIALGDKRANAVRDYLISSGIDSSRITAVSYGKEKPASYGSGPSAMAENRRAVTVFR